MILKDSYYNRGIVARWLLVCKNGNLSTQELLNLIKSIVRKLDELMLIVRSHLEIYDHRSGDLFSDLSEPSPENMAGFVASHSGSSLRFSGPGRIYLNNSRRPEGVGILKDNYLDVQDLVTFGIHLSDWNGLTCFVETKSDIWLPFSLRGQP